MKKNYPTSSSYVESLIPYPPGKPMEELTREYGIKQVIKLASNENPIGPSPLAVAAIQAALSGLNRYPDGSGYYLKKALGQRLGLEPGWILLGNGSNEVIELALKTFIKPGDEVVSPFPSFLMYRKAVQALGGQNKLIPLKRYRIDLRAMSEGIGRRSRVVLVNNPNNPTGTIVTRAEWERFLERVPPRVLILLDEAYIDFTDDSACPRGVDYLTGRKNLLIVRTFSKAYGLAGLRVGFGLGHPYLIDLMDRVRQPFNVNSLAQAGALGALRDASFYQKSIRMIRKGKKALELAFRSLGLPFIPSQANFILVKVPCDSRKLYEDLLRKGVIVRSMASFGLPRFIRVNVGLPKENRRLISELRRALET